MIHLFLAVPLLASPPGLVERLQLGALPEPQARVAAREVLAGAGGALAGHLLAFGVLTQQDSVLLRDCHGGDACGPSALFFVSFFAAELLAGPLASAGLATAVTEDPEPRFLRAWGMATAADVLGFLFMLPAGFAGDFGPAVVIPLVVVGFALQLSLVGLATSFALHDAPSDAPPSPAVLPPEPPKPMEEPPPHAGPTLSIPLAFAF